MNILNIVEEKAAMLNASMVREIEIDVGALSGIDCEALNFAMQCTPKSEVLEQAILVINRIPAQARCNYCMHEFIIDDYYSPCPDCHQFSHDIFRGKELRIRAIKIDESGK